MDPIEQRFHPYPFIIFVPIKKKTPKLFNNLEIRRGNRINVALNNPCHHGINDVTNGSLLMFDLTQLIKHRYLFLPIPNVNSSDEFNPKY